MTENQKRIAIVIVVIIIALILFMRGGSNNVTSINNSGNIPLSELQGGSINIAGRNPFVLPDFGSGASNNNLSAIGACCANCRDTGTRQVNRSAGPRINFVTNMGNVDRSNTVNYYTPIQQPQFINRRIGLMVKMKPSR